MKLVVKKTEQSQATTGVTVDRICQEFRARRTELRISQSELSRRSGLHRSYIGDMERGARNLSVKNMTRVATALGFSTMTEFFNRVENHSN